MQTAAHQLRGDGDVLHSICLPSGLLDYQIDTLWSFPVLGVLRAYRFGLRLFVFSGFTAVVPRPPPVASFSLCGLRLFVIKRIYHLEQPPGTEVSKTQMTLKMKVKVTNFQ